MANEPTIKLGKEDTWFHVLPRLLERQRPPETPPAYRPLDPNGTMARVRPPTLSGPISCQLTGCASLLEAWLAAFFATARPSWAKPSWSMLPSASPTIMRRISKAPSGLVAGCSTRGAYAGVASLSRVWFHPHTETTKTAVAAKALPKVDFKVMDACIQAKNRSEVTTDEPPQGAKSRRTWKEWAASGREDPRTKHEGTQSTCFSAWYEDRTRGPLST